MKTKIEITKQLIKTGIPESISSCPVARAINKELKRKYKAYVGGHVTIERLDSEFDKTNLGLPRKVDQFINQFDNILFLETSKERTKARAKLKPISFYLDIPKEYLK